MIITPKKLCAMARELRIYNGHYQGCYFVEHSLAQEFIKDKKAWQIVPYIASIGYKYKDQLINISECERGTAVRCIFFHMYILCKKNKWERNNLSSFDQNILKFENWEDAIEYLETSLSTGILELPKDIL